MFVDFCPLLYLLHGEPHLRDPLHELRSDFGWVVGHVEDPLVLGQPVDDVQRAGENVAAPKKMENLIIKVVFLFLFLPTCRAPRRSHT